MAGAENIREEGIEGLKELSPRKSLIVMGNLTKEDPKDPEIVTKMDCIDAVFKHFKPSVKVKFNNLNGRPVSEDFYFDRVEEFKLEELITKSPFLNGLKKKSEFLRNIKEQLAVSNELKNLLVDEEAKKSLLKVLQAILHEMQTSKRI